MPAPHAALRSAVFVVVVLRGGRRQSERLPQGCGGRAASRRVSLPLRRVSPRPVLLGGAAQGARRRRCGAAGHLGQVAAVGGPGLPRGGIPPAGRVSEAVLGAAGRAGAAARAPQVSARGSPSLGAAVPYITGREAGEPVPCLPVSHRGRARSLTPGTDNFSFFCFVLLGFFPPTSRGRGAGRALAES